MGRHGRVSKEVHHFGKTPLPLHSALQFPSKNSTLLPSFGSKIPFPLHSNLFWNYVWKLHQCFTFLQKDSRCCLNPIFQLKKVPYFPSKALETALFPRKFFFSLIFWVEWSPLHPSQPEWCTSSVYRARRWTADCCSAPCKQPTDGFFNHFQRLTGVKCCPRRSSLFFVDFIFAPRLALQTTDLYWYWLLCPSPQREPPKRTWPVTISQFNAGLLFWLQSSKP